MRLVLRMIVPSCVLVVRCHSMRVCRVGAGGELCEPKKLELKIDNINIEYVNVFNF